MWAGAGLRLKSLCGFARRAALRDSNSSRAFPDRRRGAAHECRRHGRLDFRPGRGGPADDPRRRGADAAASPSCASDYRECRELLDAIALGRALRPAAQAEGEAISRQIDVYRRKRHETQPREPSAGCVFKNPPGDSAGRLIDELGLKGERVGDAEVSPVHANFIINRGQATSADIIALMRRVRERVQQARAITLEPEVLLYGQDWRDVL